MNKILKYGLLGAGAVAGIAVAGVAYIAVTFNSNDYKPQIIQAVKDSKLANGFTDSAIRFDVEVDQFDADLYMPKVASADGNKAETVRTIAAVPDQSLDLSALKNLDLEGGLRIGALKVANMKLAQVPST